LVSVAAAFAKSCCNLEVQVTHAALTFSVVFFSVPHLIVSFVACGTDPKDKETMDRFRIPPHLIQHGLASAVVTMGCATTSKR